MVDKRNGKASTNEGASMKVSAKAMKRAIRMASKDGSRPILNCIHLDANGDMVATDTYKLYRERGVWDGPSIDVPQTVAKFVADSKGEATIEVTDHTVKATMDDGATFEDTRIDGKYPNYEQLFKGLERKAEATVCRKDFLDEVRKYTKQKVETMMLMVQGCKPKVCGGDLITRAAKGGKVAPRRFELACDGEDIELGVNPKYLRDCLLSTEGRILDLRFTSPIKPLLIQSNGMEVILMPVRLEEGVNMKGKETDMKWLKKEEAVAKKQTKKQEKPEAKEESMAKNTVKYEKAKVWVAPTVDTVEERDGYRFADKIGEVELYVGLVKENGGWTMVDTYTGTSLGGHVYSTRNAAAKHYFDAVKAAYEKVFMTEMHEAKASDFSKKRLHAKGVETKGEQMKRQEKELAKKAEAAAKAKAGADVKATVTEHADVTAIELEPHDAREHAAHDATEHAVAEAAAVETLSFIDGDAESAEIVMAVLRELTKDGNVVVRWKGKPMAPIRVEGDTKPYQEALKERGLRWARKGFWYLKPTMA